MLHIYQLKHIETMVSIQKVAVVMRPAYKRVIFVKKIFLDHISNLLDPGVFSPPPLQILIWVFAQTPVDQTQINWNTTCEHLYLMELLGKKIIFKDANRQIILTIGFSFWEVRRWVNFFYLSLTVYDMWNIYKKYEISLFIT